MHLLLVLILHLLQTNAIQNAVTVLHSKPQHNVFVA